MGKRGGPRPNSGRPTILTKELGQEIIAICRAGNYLETAAEACGTSADVVRRWIKRGTKEKAGIYVWFSIAIKKAMAESEVTAIRIISEAGAWQALAWRTERRFPKRWARRDPPERKAKSEEPPTMPELEKRINEKLGIKDNGTS